MKSGPHCVPRRLWNATVGHIIVVRLEEHFDAGADPQVVAIPFVAYEHHRLVELAWEHTWTGAAFGWVH